MTSISGYMLVLVAGLLTVIGAAYVVGRLQQRDRLALECKAAHHDGYQTARSRLERLAARPLSKLDEDANPVVEQRGRQRSAPRHSAELRASRTRRLVPPA